MEVISYIGIGSNLGNRKKNIEKAIVFLKADKKIKLLKKSRIYETEPLGPPQRKFLNGVLKIETKYSPFELLRRLKEIELLLGRKGSPRWGPRTIDLDILFYGRLVLKTKKLTLPHPQVSERLFVLKPLCEISPYLKHPVIKKSIKTILKNYETNKKN
ncbi:MAG: 2-amino-4-hydroxy-6-hydroxymethyldihydropteridine diphosphokinase [Candidatus Omnitrophica bacterium]|nr:2-amino-4-hydroxy-6-hydroxymethyldihydropteridine diphosphokinase [Candidatus Omnitrophota bacterium]MCM8794031.1 2-amino-4-hydroxy-6-hydroxymethyldihydropteridine diphosphokinase [Candidatus Omnitrophota bacterium]